MKENAPEAGTRVTLEQLLAATQRISGESLCAGNDAHLLVDGPSTFKSMFKDIDHAMDHIYLETYILEDDVIGKDPRVWNINTRDHRKILVIDGHVAYAVGINFSDVYNQSSLSVPRYARDADGAWRDTDVRIEGPVVNRSCDGKTVRGRSAGGR